MGGVARSRGRSSKVVGVIVARWWGGVVRSRGKAARGWVMSRNTKECMVWCDKKGECKNVRFHRCWHLFSVCRHCMVG